ncbi:uncharacterized protein LOC103281785 isoform X2 [Anolis carolinensis]|uniref:uncharacterized protein LOC103281785 isoform X2 n=1 Tax=Anolis carolinensis TaxID=28377 RepID=UPI002F2B2006
MGPFPLVAAAAAVAEGARHTSALSPFLPLLPFFRRRDGAPQSEVPPEELPLPPPPRHGSPPRARPAPPRLCRMGPPLPPCSLPAFASTSASPSPGATNESIMGLAVRLRKEDGRAKEHGCSGGRVRPTSPASGH